MNVDDNQGQDHFFRIDLVTRAQSLNEMRRRIDMRSPLAHAPEQSAFLNDRVAEYQQLRIALNKFWQFRRIQRCRYWTQVLLTRSQESQVVGQYECVAQLFALRRIRRNWNFFKHQRALFVKNLFANG